MSRNRILLRALSGKGFIQFNKSVAKHLGVYCTLMLGEMISLDDLFKGEEFFYQIERLMEDTTMSKEMASKSITRLKELGLLDVVKKGAPCKNHYKLNAEQVLNYLDKIDDDVEVPSTSGMEIRQLDVGKADHLKSEKQTTSDTEIRLQSNNINNNKSNNKGECESELEDKSEEEREKQAFDIELLKAHESLTSITLTTYETLFETTCLMIKDRDKRDNIKLSLDNSFINRCYDWRQCIDFLIKEIKNENTETRFRWTNFLLKLLVLLKEGHPSIDKFINSNKRQVIIKRNIEKLDLEKKEAIENDITHQVQVEVANKLGITLEQLHQYLFDITKLSMQGILEFELSEDLETDIKNYLEKNNEVQHERSRA